MTLRPRRSRPQRERLDEPELQLFRGTPTLTSVTDKVSRIVEGPPPRWWWIAFGFSLSLLGLGVFAATYLISTGVGVWGLNQPVGWAFDITNFVFWVGIGHAGTLISAILLLFRQKWRTSINRFAEAMTLFAVACAGIFPLIHVGRIWMMWFLAPVPNSNAIWQNFRSPLLWDVFAVSTYALVSLMFWYVGLIPDLATIRDRSRSRVRQVRVRLTGAGLAWFGRPLATLRDGRLPFGRAFNSSGVECSYGRQFRLRRVGDSRLACDGFSTLLRGGSHILGLRHGVDSDDPLPPVIRTAGSGHGAPPGHDESRDVGHQPDGGLRLRHRILHCLV